MANKFNHKRYRRVPEIERNTYFYVTGKHCGVDIQHAPVVETPLAYTKRMQNKEREEAWIQFVKSQKCDRCYSTCEDIDRCSVAFDKTFIPRYVYRGEP